MTQTPDTLFVVGPDIAQTLPSQIYVTPTGGAQQTLADALANGGSTLLKATSVTSNGTGAMGSLPENAFLLRLLLRNTTSSAVNVTLGTTSGGSDIGPNLSAAPWTVPANGTLTADIGSFLLGWFSATARQSIFLASASWGSASVNAKLDYEVGP